MLDRDLYVTVCPVALVSYRQKAGGKAATRFFVRGARGAGCGVK